MSFLYKVFASGVYYALWPYGRIRAGMGNKLWRGRLGLLDNQNPADIWIHAASVGETKVACYLIDYLLKHKTEIKIYLTTMTVAGQKVAEEIQSKNVTVGFFPIDHVRTIQNTLNKINPRMLIIAETEIWPNLIESADAKNIAIVLVNARMSDRAFKKYKIISGTMKRLLSHYEKFFVKTENDKVKFESFGIPDSKLVVSGDMKFDAPLLPHSEGRRSEIRSRLGANERDFVFVAGSTRPGEEKLLLQLLKSFGDQDNKTIMVIAPRHLNRLEEIKTELSSRQIEFNSYGDSSAGTHVILVEQMGALDDLYLAADLAFVGGSLVNIGGHNILEPVWAGCPVTFGPFTSNVKEAKDYILKYDYGKAVANIDELTEIVTKFKDGRVTFQKKQNEDIEHSPTAVAGDYIIERLSNA